MLQRLHPPLHILILKSHFLPLFLYPCPFSVGKGTPPILNTFWIRLLEVDIKGHCHCLGGTCIMCMLWVYCHVVNCFNFLDWIFVFTPSQLIEKLQYAEQNVWLLPSFFKFIPTGFFIPFNFLPDLAKDLKLDKTQGATLISVIGVSNTFSRLFVGYVTDRPWADSLVINNLALMIGGAATFAVPFYDNFIVLIIYSIVFGASIGLRFS